MVRFLVFNFWFPQNRDETEILNRLILLIMLLALYKRFVIDYDLLNMRKTRPSQRCPSDAAATEHSLLVTTMLVVSCVLFVLSILVLDVCNE